MSKNGDIRLDIELTIVVRHEEANVAEVWLGFWILRMGVTCFGMFVFFLSVLGFGAAFLGLQRKNFDWQ